MVALQSSRTNRIVQYDAARRRLWIAGQRCHHGATGALVAGVGVTGLAAQLAAIPTALALAATGSVLMAHDWNDRSIWFERGRGTQP
jgi:hypothetical protein